MNMPTIDGHETARLMINFLNEKGLELIPIIASTAYDKDHIKKELQTSAICDYI